MLKSRTLTGLFVLTAATILAGLAPQPEPKPAAPIDKKMIAAAMATQGLPADEHKVLESMIGDFDVELRISMMPSQPPVIVHNKSSGQWILGNRFVQYATRPADGEEIKMESLSTFGYDKRTKKYFWIGIDSSDTYAVFAEGDYDKATQTLTLLGENLEPGQGKVPFQVIMKPEADGKRSFQIWFQIKGAPGANAEGWFKVVESISTPAK